MRIEIAGQNAFIVYFAEQTSAAVSAQIQAAVANITATMRDSIVDLVPSYASLLVIYDQDRSDHFAVKLQLRTALSNLDSVDASTGELVTLPVYYSAESGPDLETIAQRGNLAIDDVIEIHQQQEYRVYAIGFAPGFAYLGEVDERIAAPRLATPRQKVPRGAVAIADRQTAVYPAVSPGGWNLIGLCPMRMFDAGKTPSMPVQVGDRIRFTAISREEFIAQGGKL
ncbi:MAG: 5-oxoprolinase subunit PxpB [Gammaproteobacteria bacterium]|nr:5-oxoprolinase subunit PxpB [Gammaproteobacteria bacterium]MDH3858974.1 5-oxoprolinase subunit PxpB [Gammaproteobacteria bacterium]